MSDEQQDKADAGEQVAEESVDRQPLEFLVGGFSFGAEWSDDRPAS